MACWNHQSRNAKALRCCRTNGLADSAYSFITPVNIAYAYELTNFSCAGARRRFRIAAVCAQADAKMDSSAA